MKDNVGKLDINKLVNLPMSSNNLKTKLDDLDVGKLKTVPVDFKKISDVKKFKKLLKTQNSTH